jgi:hypothetical protein
MKLLIPNRRDRFRLVADLPRPHAPDLPAGTVFRVDKTRVNQAARDDEVVWCTVLASPDPALAMKKYGGTSSYGEFFSLPNDLLRTLDVELVEGMD